MIDEEDSVLAAEYALGLLRGEEREAFTARLAREPELAAELRAWDEDFATFADGIAPVAPPAKLQQKLEQRLFGASVAKPTLWSSLNFWRGFAIASVAGVIALGAWNLRKPFDGAPNEVLVAQVAGDSSAVKLAAYFDEGKGELRLNRTDGTAASGRSLELWLIAGNDAPVSLGVLSSENAMRISVPANLRSKFKNGVLAISDEPQGGSPTGAPTGAVLATGKLTVI